MPFHLDIIHRKHKTCTSHHDQFLFLQLFTIELSLIVKISFWRTIYTISNYLAKFWIFINFINFAQIISCSYFIHTLSPNGFNQIPLSKRVAWNTSNGSINHSIITSNLLLISILTIWAELRVQVLGWSSRFID